MTDAAHRVVDLYERHALAWDAERGRNPFERPWLDRFAALLPSRGAVLDIGCGGAEPIARFFIENGYDIAGADTSPTLIGLCKDRFPQHEWIVADMRGLRLGRQFDGVIAWDSFFHLCPQDQRRMFPVFRAHAAAKAALMFTSGPSFGEAIGTYKNEPLYHGSLDAAEYRTLLAENSFAVVSHVVEDPACGRHTVWLAQFR
ncbi:MAG: class I SAM-dependent methyltransferase [Hyphomicrobiaceae bacterium]